MTLVMVGWVCLLMNSCATYTNTTYTARSTSIRQNEISSKSLGTEIEVDFSRRVTGQSDAQILKSDAIDEAQYRCISENNIDVLVDPIYKIEFSMFQKKAYKVTVVGYAGMYKQVKTGVDAVVEKNYNVEDIEKYKLISDPSFYKYYYQKEPVKDGDVTNFYINSNRNSNTKGSTPVVTTTPTSMVVQPTQEPVKQQMNVNTMMFDAKYRKSKKLRDAGVGMFTTGVVELGLVFPLLLCLGDANYGDPQWVSSWAFCALGMGSIISGIPMWAVGSHRMKKASDPQLSIGGTKDGVGMRLTF